MRRLVAAALPALLLVSACQRGPQYCVFDGTFVGRAPAPFVALGGADLAVTEAPEKYAWQEFTWPTDPAIVHVRPDADAWVVEGTYAGASWTLRGRFPDGTTFEPGASTGTPPPLRIEGRGGKPVQLTYRVRPCRAFEGSQTGVRTCTRWGAEANARTRLTCG